MSTYQWCVCKQNAAGGVMNGDRMGVGSSEVGGEFGRGWGVQRFLQKIRVQRCQDALLKMITFYSFLLSPTKDLPVL